MGVIGATVYFLTEEIDRKEKQDIERLAFVERLVLAAFMSFAIGIIFFHGKAPGSEPAGFNFDIAYLICFSAGYSYELIKAILKDMVKQALAKMSIGKVGADAAGNGEDIIAKDVETTESHIDRQSQAKENDYV
jgi:hypothetical protein